MNLTASTPAPDAPVAPPALSEGKVLSALKDALICKPALRDAAVAGELTLEMVREDVVAELGLSDEAAAALSAYEDCMTETMNSMVELLKLAYLPRSLRSRPDAVICTAAFEEADRFGISEEQAVYNLRGPPLNTDAPFRLPSTAPIHGCWHVLAEGYMVRYAGPDADGEPSWVWGGSAYVGVDCLVGSIATEQQAAPMLHIDVYLVDPGDRQCYGAFSCHSLSVGLTETVIVFKSRDGGWWTATYREQGHSGNRLVSCEASADPLAGRPFPEPLYIAEDEAWHGFMSEVDESFVSRFDASGESVLAGARAALGAGWSEAGPRAPGSDPHRRLKFLHKIFSVMREMGTRKIMSIFLKLHTGDVY